MEIDTLEGKTVCVIDTEDIGYVVKVEKGLALVSFGTSGESYIPADCLKVVEV